MDKALGVNMSRCDRLPSKATGELRQLRGNPLRGLRAGGIADVDCVKTAHRGRRAMFSKCGGNLGTDGSVSFMFKKVGVLSYPAGSNEDAITEAAIDAGADDIGVSRDSAIDVIPRRISSWR
jgi:hypothetical protein